MSKYVIRDREAGNVIESSDDLRYIADCLAEYEEQDKKDGTFTEDFYEIYNSEAEEAVGIFDIVCVFEEQDASKPLKTYDLLSGVFDNLDEAKKYAEEMQDEEPLYIARYTDYMNGNYEYL